MAKEAGDIFRNVDAQRAEARPVAEPDVSSERPADPDYPETITVGPEVFRLVPLGRERTGRPDMIKLGQNGPRHYILDSHADKSL